MYLFSTLRWHVMKVWSSNGSYVGETQSSRKAHGKTKWASPKMPPKCTEKLRSGFTVLKFSQKSSDIRSVVWHSHMAYNLCALLLCMSSFGLCILTLTHPPPPPTSTGWSVGFLNCREMPHLQLGSEMIMVMCYVSRQSNRWIFFFFLMLSICLQSVRLHYVVIIWGASSKSATRKDNTHGLVFNL